MEGTSTLELLAELAVGVLGFSGIVAAIGRRGSAAWTPLDQRRFFSMVLLGALVIILALLPFPLHRAGLEGVCLRGWSSGIAAPVVFLFTSAVRRTSPSNTIPDMWRDSSVNNVVLVFGLLVTFGTPILLLLNAAGILLGRTFTPYLVAALLNFSVTVLTFVRLHQSAVRVDGGRV